MAASNAGEYKTRRILAAMDDEIGVLKPDVRALVDGRNSTRSGGATSAAR